MYKGDLMDFPIEIVEKMLEYQVQQGNPRDVTIFEDTPFCGKKDGGFEWEETPEGWEFWNNVIADEFFGHFYETYPKPESKTTSVQTYIDFMTANKINMLVWSWNDCPFDEKHLLSHGGDEDHVVLFKIGDWQIENAVDRLMICDRNSCQYGEYELTVTAHS